MTFGAKIGEPHGAYQTSKYITCISFTDKERFKVYRKIIPGCVTSLETVYKGIFDQQEVMDSTYQTALINRFNAYRADEVASDMRCLVCGSFQMKSNELCNGKL